VKSNSRRGGELPTRADRLCLHPRHQTRLVFRLSDYCNACCFPIERYLPLSVWLSVSPNRRDKRCESLRRYNRRSLLFDVSRCAPYNKIIFDATSSLTVARFGGIYETGFQTQTKKSLRIVSYHQFCSVELAVDRCGYDSQSGDTT